MFYPCPTDILNAEEWFVDLWNYSVCPYFIQTVRHGIKKYGERANEWTDPLEWILKTYPWSYEKSKLKFIKIRMEDVGYKETSQLSETSKKYFIVFNDLILIILIFALPLWCNFYFIYNSDFCFIIVTFIYSAIRNGETGKHCSLFTLIFILL